MAFDDLAKHMASRDRKRKILDGAGTADQILADLGSQDLRRRVRAMDPRREIALGVVLLLAGLLGTAGYLVYLLYVMGWLTGTPPRPIYLYSSPLLALMVGLAIVGAQKLIRGLRARAPVPRATAVERS